MVEFPDYVGPPISESFTGDKRKWIPIYATKRNCDTNCCHRRGFPLTCGKAVTIHRLQGLTIGELKVIKRLILLWKKTDEEKWPSILYVALSRVQRITDLMLDMKISGEDLKYLGQTEGAKKKQRAHKELQKKADEYRKEKQSIRRIGSTRSNTIAWGTEADFKAQLLEFIESELIVVGSEIPDEDPAHTEIRKCLQQWKDKAPV